MIRFGGSDIAPLFEIGFPLLELGDIAWKSRRGLEIYLTPVEARHEIKIPRIRRELLLATSEVSKEPSPSVVMGSEVLDRDLLLLKLCYQCQNSLEFRLESLGLRIRSLAEILTESPLKEINRWTIEINDLGCEMLSLD